jgi:hypothetical protein
MYTFLDIDERSETFGKYSVRDGAMSYDGFETEEEAESFMADLLAIEKDTHG